LRQTKPNHIRSTR